MLTWSCNGRLRLLLVLATAITRAAGACWITPDANGHVDTSSEPRPWPPCQLHVGLLRCWPYPFLTDCGFSMMSIQRREGGVATRPRLSGTWLVALTIFAGLRSAGAAFCQCPRREIAKQNHPTDDCEKWPGLEGVDAQEAVREHHPRRARPVTNSSARESSRLPDRRRPDPAFARNLFSLWPELPRLLRLLLPGAPAAPE